MFQSTHLHEVWLRRICIRRSNFRFNPHTYMRCDSQFDISFSSFSSFNPHTYMRCDLEPCFDAALWFVSIHTPTWGVTDECCRLYKHDRVSIHTPTWGVTRFKIGRIWRHMFQSTHLHEVWHFQAIQPSLCLLGFQSTHLHEVWREYPRILKEHTSFNPHTYMRCDCIYVLRLQKAQGFNPHTYMRCDLHTLPD